MGIRLLIRSLFWFNDGSITTVLLFLLVMAVDRSSSSIFTTSPLTEEIETRPFGEDTFHLFLNNVTRENILSGKLEECEDLPGQKDKSPIVINIWSYSPDGKLQLDQRKEISKRILPPPGSELEGIGSSSSVENQTDQAVPAMSLSNRILPVTVTPVTSVIEKNQSIAQIELSTIPPTTSTTNDVILLLLGTLVNLQKKLQEQEQNKPPMPNPFRGSGKRFSTAPSMIPRHILDLELELSKESTNYENATIFPEESQELPFETLYFDILRLTKADRIKAQVKMGRADDYNYSFDDEDFSRNLGEEGLKIGNLTIESRPLNARLMHNLFNLTSASDSSSLAMKIHCVPTLKEDGINAQSPSPNNIPIPTSVGQGGLSSVSSKDGLFLQDWWGFGPSNKASKKKKDKGHEHEGWRDGWGWEDDKKKHKHKDKDKHKKKHKHKEKDHHEEHNHQPQGGGWGWKQVHQPSYGSGWQPQHRHEEHHGWEEEHKEEEHEKKKKKKKKKHKKKDKKHKKKKKKHGWDHQPQQSHHGWGHQPQQGHHGWGQQQQSSHNSGWEHQSSNNNHGWGKPPSKGWGPPSMGISGWLGEKDGWGWGSGHDGYYEMEFIPADVFSKLLTGFGFMALLLGPVVFVAGICWIISSLKSSAYVVHGRSGGGWGWHRRIGLHVHDEPPMPKFRAPRKSKSRFSRFGFG